MTAINPELQMSIFDFKIFNESLELSMKKYINIV